MKQHWLKLEARIDSMSLRERAMVFMIAALVLVTLVNTFLLDPLLATQDRLSQQSRQEQQQISAMQAEIQMRVKSHNLDPDGPNRQRLRRLKQQSADARDELLGLQKSMVSPDKMASVLEDLLKANSRLRLVALKTVPATPLNETSQVSNDVAKKQGVGSRPQPKENEASAGLQDKNTVYKHGVEIVVQGGYGDLLAYLSQVEGLPWQLFWESARLNVVEYPKSTLRLTLFTLSLDKTWLNI